MYIYVYIYIYIYSRHTLQHHICVKGELVMWGKTAVGREIGARSELGDVGAACSMACQKNCSHGKETNISAEANVCLLT